MEIYAEICAAVEAGKKKLVIQHVQQAIDTGCSAQEILNKGLLEGMERVGRKFRNNEIFVPEVLVAARAMSAGTDLIKEKLSESGVKAKGKICLGTVKGDLHDIGKNLVRLMFEGKGLDVIDLGVDVEPQVFVRTAIEQNCDIVACSSLLTTSMPMLDEVVKAIVAAGIRDKVKIMIGGAPVTEEYCRRIGADCYTPDAASAADAAVKLLSTYAQSKRSDAL